MIGERGWGGLVIHRLQHVALALVVCCGSGGGE